MIFAVFGNILFCLETELTATTSVNRLCIGCLVLRASGDCVLAASVFKVAIDKVSTIIYIRNTFKDEPLYRLALFHSPTGAAWCFPSIQPLLSRSTLQHDHWNPLMNSSYSINVQASPSTSGSKSSHTSCSELTSRLPCVTCQCFASNDRIGGGGRRVLTRVISARQWISVRGIVFEAAVAALRRCLPLAVPLTSHLAGRSSCVRS